jgi:hypothetical protein
MPLPKGQKNYAKNPFNVHCLSENSLISGGTACMMESAWDKAINLAITAASSNGASKTVEQLKKLLSWEQRNA